MLAEQFASINPYQFGFNNPVMFNDPMGDLSQADWDDFKSRLGTGSNLNGFGDYGGSYSGGGGGGFTPFTSNDQAFGWGVGNMNASGGWGSQPGWATSFGNALHNYGGGITSSMVQGYYQSHWSGSGRNDISASNAGGVHSGQGFNVNWFSDISVSQGGIAAGSMFLSYDKAMSLLGGEGNNHDAGNGSYDWVMQKRLWILLVVFLGHWKRL